MSDKKIEPAISNYVGLNSDMKEDRSSNVDTEIMDGLGERAAAVVLDGFVEEIKKAEVCHLSENLFRQSRVCFL